MARKKILDRRSPGAQICPKCGKKRVEHPTGLYFTCDIGDQVILALRLFRQHNGAFWRARLVATWNKGEDGPFLREARDKIGPARLYKIDLDLARVKGDPPHKHD